MSKSRSGNKKRGLTRNQKRKADYKAKSEAENNRKGQGKRAGRSAKKQARPAGTRVHRRPCGNHACVDCRGL